MTGYDLFVSPQSAMEQTHRSPTFRSREGTMAISYAPSVPRPPCQTVEELTDALVEDMEAATRSTVPECITSELTLALSALVPLHRPVIGPYAEGGERDLPAEYKTNWIASGKDGKKQHPQASAYAIVFANGQEARQVVQRAASRGILAAIETADGFKYSFNNAWAAKDDDGMRFSYICQDSTQNKDRHANGFPKTLKHLKGAGERGPRKETFDCKGSVSVKFSLQKGLLEVFYRHYAIHPTVKERKPFARAPRSTAKRRPNYARPLPNLSLDADADQNTNQNISQDGEDTGGLFGKLQEMRFAYVKSSAPPKAQTMAEANASQAPNIGRPLKRKREDENVLPRPPSKVLSLAEILKQSQIAKSPPNPKEMTTPESNGNARPPPMEYSLPSWQMAPSAPPPPAPEQPHPAPITQPPNLPSSYQQPYQPNTPSYPPPHQQPGQEAYLSQPKQYPKTQGLFTTMKPMHTPPGTTDKFRAKLSCTNCRHAKRKVSPFRSHPRLSLQLISTSAMKPVQSVTLAPRRGG
jgi:hypothetical protein